MDPASLFLIPLVTYVLAGNHFLIALLLSREDLLSCFRKRERARQEKRLLQLEIRLAWLTQRDFRHPHAALRLRTLTKLHLDPDTALPLGFRISMDLGVLESEIVELERWHDLDFQDEQELLSDPTN